MRRPLRPSMKQISDGETTTSSRPAFRGLTAASVMVFRLSLVADGNDSFYHTPPVTSRQPSPTLPFVREPAPDVVDFYDRHPINETQVLASARDGTAGLRALVRLGPLVRHVRGDAQVLPFRSRSFDAVVSQEGLLHVPDKAAVLAECARVLRPGARLAFSDWIARPRLEDNERRRLSEWMAAVALQSIDGYRTRLARAGFDRIVAEDLSGEWIAILQERQRMYRGLREQTVARLGQARYGEYNQLYGFFVALVEAGKLGGARFSGARSEEHTSELQSQFHLV